MVAIIAAGDNVVDCYPALGKMFPGGNALNVAVFAARSGARTSYVGAVAPDAAGATITLALIGEGVDIEQLRTCPGDTAYCVIGHRDGDRVFVRSDLGVSRFQLTSADLDIIARHDAVHVSQSSGLDPAVPDLAACTRVSYDFSTRRDPEHLAVLAPHCFLASFSGGDLADDAALDLAASAVSAGATWSLVTRGAAGAVLVGEYGTFTTPAAPGEIVDTLGAGDTFIARVLVGLIGGEEPGKAMTDAAARAAETCTRFGAFGYQVPIEIPESPAVIVP